MMKQSKRKKKVEQKITIFLTGFSVRFLYGRKLYQLHYTNHCSKVLDTSRGQKQETEKGEGAFFFFNSNSEASYWKNNFKNIYFFEISEKK